MARVYPRKRYPEAKTQVLPIKGWPRGLDTLVNPNQIRNDELAEAVNAAYTQYGVLSKRSGTSLVVTLPAAIQGFGVYNKRESSGSFTKYFCAVAGGTFYTIDPVNKTFTARAGHTFHATNTVTIRQGMNTLYIADGANSLVKWDGTTFTTFTPIATPTSPTVGKTGAGTGSTTWDYIVTAGTAVGETTGTTAVSLSSAPDKWDTTTYATFSWTASAGATHYNVYRSKFGSANATFLTSVTGTSFIDKGQADDTQSVTILVPDENTTSGIVFSTFEIYKNSIVGVEADNKQRLWYSAGGVHIDSFSPGDGGSWYDYHPEEGEPITGLAVFAGLGTDYLYIAKPHKIGQFAFGGDGGPQVKDVNLSIGADAAESLVLFENDMAFWGRYGGYTLRMEPNLVNVLRIAELTIRVHPTYVNAVTQSAISKVCGIYDKANHTLLWSLPLGSSTNNTSLAYDPVYLGFSEYQGIAATHFSKFTDTNNQEASYGGDSSGRVFKLFDGTSDMGSAITFRATTKTFDMDQPYAFKRIKKLFFIFGNINASNLKLSLVQDGATILKEFTIRSGSGTTGWDVDLWDAILWDTSSGTPVNINNRLVQRYYDVNKDLFSIQITYENTSSTDSFEILGLYILYSGSNKPLPSSMRLS